MILLARFRWQVCQLHLPGHFVVSWLLSFWFNNWYINQYWFSPLLLNHQRSTEHLTRIQARRSCSMNYQGRKLIRIPSVHNNSGNDTSVTVSGVNEWGEENGNWNTVHRSRLSDIWKSKYYFPNTTRIIQYLVRPWQSAVRTWCQALYRTHSRLFLSRHYQAQLSVHWCSFWRKNTTKRSLNDYYRSTMEKFSIQKWYKQSKR